MISVNIEGSVKLRNEMILLSNLLCIILILILIWLFVGSGKNWYNVIKLV